MNMSLEDELNEAIELPKTEVEKWRRYIFETKGKYYIVILQQDLFHEWSIVRIYGSKKDKRGNTLIKGCSSYEDALKKIEKIKKVRKTRKYSLKRVESCKLGINYEKVAQVVAGMI